MSDTKAAAAKAKAAADEAVAKAEEAEAATAEPPRDPSPARRMVDGTVVADEKGLQAARKANLKG